MVATNSGPCQWYMDTDIYMNNMSLEQLHAKCDCKVLSLFIY